MITKILLLLITVFFEFRIWINCFLKGQIHVRTFSEGSDPDLGYLDPDPQPWYPVPETFEAYIPKLTLKIRC